MELSLFSTKKFFIVHTRRGEKYERSVLLCIEGPRIVNVLTRKMEEAKKIFIVIHGSRLSFTGLVASKQQTIHGHTNSANTAADPDKMGCNVS